MVPNVDTGILAKHLSVTNGQICSQQTPACFTPPHFKNRVLMALIRLSAFGTGYTKRWSPFHVATTRESQERSFARATDLSQRVARNTHREPFESSVELSACCIHPGLLIGGVQGSSDLR